MTEQELQAHLADIFENITRADGGEDSIIPIAPELLDPNSGIQRVSTFAEAGVLTRSAGIVVRMRNGTELQISIVQSR